MADNPYSSLKVDLSGQTAVVTGASQGLGKAIASALAAAGAKVACVARTVEKLTQSVSAITAAGGSAEAFPCDVKEGAPVDVAMLVFVEQIQQLLRVVTCDFTFHSYLPLCILDF